jgi:hypothetical protein
MITHPDAIKKIAAKMEQLGYSQQQITEWEQNPTPDLPQGGKRRNLGSAD